MVLIGELSGLDASTYPNRLSVLIPDQIPIPIRISLRTAATAAPNLLAMPDCSNPKQSAEANCNVFAGRIGRASTNR
jgi:hypothetical protein